MKRLLFIPALLLLAIACDKSEKYYITEDDAVAFELMANPTVNHVAMMMTSDIYYGEAFGKGISLKKLTNKPKDVKTEIRLSPDHSKISYLNNNGEVMIISTADGKNLLTSPMKGFESQRFYDWMPNGHGLYFLIGDSVVFSDTLFAVAKPPITFGTGDKWKAVAYGPDNIFYFLITERSGTGSAITKLFYFDPSKQKVFLMNYALPTNEPKRAELEVSSNGDLTVLLAIGNTAYFDTYYVYPKGSLSWSMTRSQNDIMFASYDGSIKKEIYFGEDPDFGVYNNVWIQNYNGYARSVNQRIDSAYFKPYKALPFEFDWKQ